MKRTSFVTFVKINQATIIEQLLSESSRLPQLSYIYVWRVISVLGETTGQVEVEKEVEEERAIISLMAWQDKVEEDKEVEDERAIISLLMAWQDAATALAQIDKGKVGHRPHNDLLTLIRMDTTAANTT